MMQLAALYQLVQPYTMLDYGRVANLTALSHQILGAGVAGDVVECGTCRGGSAAILAAALLPHAERRIWLYDTFGGIPSPTMEDGPDAPAWVGMMHGSLEATRGLLQKIGMPDDRVVLRQGVFADTFQQALPEHVALLHVDCDWYDSVLGALRTFCPLVAAGGVIILDDFGFWEGCRRAFYRYCCESGAEPLLERSGDTQAFWIKGKEHSRA